VPISISFRNLMRDRQTRLPFHKALTLTVCEPNNQQADTTDSTE